MEHTNAWFRLTTLPPFPFSKTTSGPVREAKALHDTGVAAREGLDAIARQARQAQADLTKARGTLEEQRLASERDTDRELELADQVRRHEILADPRPFQIRFNRAAEEADRDARRYRSFIYRNGPELLAELRDDAERVAATLAEALAEVAPLRAAREAVRARVQAITCCLAENGVGGRDHEHIWQLPADEEKSPYPSPSSIEALEAELNPTPIDDADEDVAA